MPWHSEKAHLLYDIWDAGSAMDPESHSLVHFIEISCSIYKYVVSQMVIGWLEIKLIHIFLLTIVIFFLVRTVYIWCIEDGTVTWAAELLRSHVTFGKVLLCHWSSLSILYPVLFSSAALQPSAPSALHLPFGWYSSALERVAAEQSQRKSMTLSFMSFWQIFSPPRS